MERGGGGDLYMRRVGKGDLDQSGFGRGKGGLWGWKRDGERERGREVRARLD